MVTVTDKKVGEKMIPERVKVVASRVLTRQDVTSTVNRKLVGCEKLRAPIARFPAKAVKEETVKVGKVYKTVGGVAEILPAPPSSKPFRSEASCRIRKSRRNRRTRKSKRRNR